MLFFTWLRGRPAVEARLQAGQLAYPEVQAYPERRARLRLEHTRGQD
jgi:hypothetical protein